MIQLASVCATVTLCAGCLITEPIGFEADQVPAHLSNPRPASFTRVLPVRDPACPGGRTEMGPWMTFGVDISDVNASERLYARLMVNGRRVGGANIPPTGNVERDPVTICVALGNLMDNCNHVELVVTSGFDEEGETPYATLDPLDFSKAEWWVLPRVSKVPIAGQDDCSELVEDTLP